MEFLTATFPLRNIFPRLSSGLHGNHTKFFSLFSPNTFSLYSRRCQSYISILQLLLSSLTRPIHSTPLCQRESGWSFPHIFSNTFPIIFMPSPAIRLPLNLRPQVCVFLLFASSLQRLGGAAALLVTSLKPCPPPSPSPRSGAPRPYIFIIFPLKLPICFLQDRTVFPIFEFAPRGSWLLSYVELCILSLLADVKKQIIRGIRYTCHWASASLAVNDNPELCSGGLG